jgi:hypothetical protein
MWPLGASASEVPWYFLLSLSLPRIDWLTIIPKAVKGLSSPYQFVLGVVFECETPIRLLADGHIVATWHVTKP